MTSMAALDALRPLVTGPGDYMMPSPSSMAEMKSPEFIAKVQRGPRVTGGAVSRSSSFAVLVSFIAYASALWQQSIWYHRSWGITFKATFDSLLYGVLTALTFAYLWPHP